MKLIFIDQGGLSLTSAGCMILSMTKGPMKRGDSFQESVLNGIVLEVNKNFRPCLYSRAGTLCLSARRLFSADRRRAAQVSFHNLQQHQRWCCTDGTVSSFSCVGNRRS